MTAEYYSMYSTDAGGFVGVVCPRLLYATCAQCAGLSVEVISLYVGSDLRFPLVSVVEKLLLVVQQLLVGLRGKLKVWALKLKRQHQRCVCFIIYFNVLPYE